MKYKILSILLPLVFANYVTAQVNIFINGFEKIVVPIVKLNDTGITWAGELPEPTGINNANCTSTTITAPQDCNTGRDADILTNSPNDGHAGFNFTKLNASGVALIDQSVVYDTTPWACVQDNVTGLVWEVKTKGLDTITNFHRFIITYKWGGDTAIGKGHQNAKGTYYDPSWNALVQGSNTETLCGFNNWRVPTVAELSSIVNKGTFTPAIDTNYFPQTQSSWYWSSSPVANDSANAWPVDFTTGGNLDVTGGLNTSRFNPFHVRLVRSGQ